MQLLLDSARTPSFRVWALNSPYDKKDLLKQRRYRWSGGEGGLPKAWYTFVSEAEVAGEQAWLTAEVYDGRAGGKVERMDARTRYAEEG